MYLAAKITRKNIKDKENQEKKSLRLHEGFGEVGLGEETLHEVNDFFDLESFGDVTTFCVCINASVFFCPEDINPEAVFGHYHLVERFEQTFLGTLKDGLVDTLRHTEEGVLHQRQD